MRESAQDRHTSFGGDLCAVVNGASIFHSTTFKVDGDVHRTVFCAEHTWGGTSDKEQQHLDHVEHSDISIVSGVVELMTLYEVVETACPL